MHLHSTLDGRAGEFRVRGAAWALNSLSFRGFLYLIPIRGGGDGKHRVVEAEGEDLWKLLAALSEQVTSITGAAVKRLDARAVGAERAHRTERRSGNRSTTPDRSQGRGARATAKAGPGADTEDALLAVPD
jgi:hypothetical protein